MKNNKIKYLEHVEKRDKPDLPVIARNIAKVVFYDKNGRFLLQERKSVTKTGEEWGLFGGGIDKGESPRKALKRELSEEIAELPAGLKFIKIAELKTFFYNKLMNNYRELYEYVFACELPSNIKIKVLEGDSARWFTYAEAKKLKMIPGNIGVIEIVETINQ